MGQLLDQFAVDFTDLFLASGLEEDAQFVPQGKASGMAIKVVIGDHTPAMVEGLVTTEDRRAATIVASLSDVRAILVLLVGSLRDPIRGDAIVVSGGPGSGSSSGGRWVVQESAPDQCGGVSLTCVRVAIDSVGVRGAQAVR